MGRPKLSLDDQIFELKFNAKQLSLEAKRAERDEARHRQEVFRAMQQGRRDLAEIKAQLAIAKRAQAMNLYRMSGRIEVMASQLQISSQSTQLAAQISGINKSLEAALGQMDVTQISRIMIQLDDQCKALNINTEVMQGVMSEQGAQVTDPAAVSRLLREVADENAMSLDGEYADLQAVEVAPKHSVQAPTSGIR